jgi:glycosyltransferase involved in cell wall biosynthesis
MPVRTRRKNDSMHADPLVSIIISAYNRPRVISFAIKSVLASDFDDWELIVVGDGCNAETEDAVRVFTDPRIKFHNLPENTGHQSAPHNKGVELARGEFVFFLNQDDMYFADHISKRVAFMRTTGTEVSWSPILLLQHSGLERGLVDVEKDRLILDGAPPDGRYSTDVILQFTFPDAASPRELGINDDSRQLGMGLISLELTPWAKSLAC